MQPVSFKRHRFPAEVIRHPVWLYFRFTLSFRDVEEMLAERGIDVSYETIRYWTLKFGRLFAQNLRRSGPRPTGRWHLDEMVVKINGQRMWLWRAVDDEGAVVDMLVQKRRNTVAAIRLLRKLLKRQGAHPEIITTDRLASLHGPFLRSILVQGSMCPQPIVVAGISVQRAPQRIHKQVATFCVFPSKRLVSRPNCRKLGYRKMCHLAIGWSSSPLAKIE